MYLTWLGLQSIDRGQSNKLSMMLLWQTEEQGKGDGAVFNFHFDPTIVTCACVHKHSVSK